MKKKRVENNNVMTQTNQQSFKNFLLNALTVKNLIVCITVFTLALVAFFIIFPSRSFFNSDYTDTILWAQASYDSSSIFNPDFSYACLVPFGGYLIMIPLIAIFGVTMTAHVLGMLIFYIIFVVSLFMMLKYMGWNTQWRCFTVSMLVITLSISVKLREIFWGHVIYYSLGILFLFVGLALVYRMLTIIKTQQIKSFKFIFNLTLLFIWFTLCATDQVEALTLFILPTIAGFVGERFFEFKQKMDKLERIKNTIVLAVMLFGTGIGYLLGNILKADLIASYQTSYSAFSDPSQWILNIHKFLSHWLILLGVNIGDGEAMFSKHGIINIICIISAIIIFLAPIILTFLYPKIKNRATRIFIIAHWTMTALIMVGYVFGKLSEANWRLSPIVCTSVIMTAILCKYIYQNTDKKRFLILLITPILIMGSITSFRIIQMTPTWQESHLYDLSDFLEENELTYGYATFWNANAITVISDSDVQVRSVDILEGACNIRLYQTQEHWYEDIPGQENYFLLVSDYEFIDLNQAGYYPVSDAVEILAYNGYKILVFDKNIFS